MFESMPKIDVVIATYNRPKSLIRLLNSFKSQNCSFDNFNVYVVNDRSDIEYPELSGYPFKVEFIDRPGERRGPAVYSARNIGIKAGKNEVVVICEDDITVESSFILVSQLCHKIHRNLVLVSPFYYATKNPDQFQHIGKNVWLCGGVVSVRRKYIEQVEGYDENFDGSMGFADVELAHRLFKCGLDGWMAPGILVKHDDSETGSWRHYYIYNVWRKEHPGETDPNLAYLYKKWPKWKEMYG